MNIKIGSVLKEFKEGKFRNAYLLFGENEYSIKEVIETIKKDVLNPGFGSFDQENFDVLENGFSYDEVERALLTPPMASIRRLVILKNVHKLGKSAQGNLLGFLSSHIDTSLLVMTAISDRNIKVAFFEEIKKLCCSLVFKNLRSDMLPRWILDYIRQMGYTIEPDAILAILEYAGNNQMSLSSEIEKMITYVGAKRKLAKEDVLAVLTSNKVKTVFDLQDAVGTRKLKDSLSILQYLLEWGEVPAKILGVLRGFFIRLSGMMYYKRKGLLNWDTAKKLGIMHFNFRKEINYLKNFTDIELRKRLKLLYDAEISSKTGGDLDYVLTYLVYNLI